jgi:hypothetical protein
VRACPSSDVITNVSIMKPEFHSSLLNIMAIRAEGVLGKRDADGDDAQSYLQSIITRIADVDGCAI